MSASKTIVLHCDNIGAIQLAKNRNYHARTKHINVRKSFIQECLFSEGTSDEENRRIIKLEYLPTKQMVADIMTKAVNRIKLNGFLPDFGLGHKANEN